MSFYWADSGFTTNLQAEVTIGNRRYAPATRINVVQPEHGLSVQFMHTTTMFDGYGIKNGMMMLGRPGKPKPNDPEARLGGVDAPGIVFNAFVATPWEFEKGRFAIVQMASPNTRLLGPRGLGFLDFPKPLSRGAFNGLTGLDTSFPYGFDRPNKTATASAQWNPTCGFGHHEGSDSPRTGVFLWNRHSVAVDGALQAEVDHGFTMFLIFQPAGELSRWIPLAKVNWWWRAKAEYSQTLGTWHIVGDTSGHADPEETADHPQWNKNMANYKHDVPV